MAITPLLRQLKEGYFLTFQSTGEDLTYTFGNQNSSNKFKFSYYALLEIPPIVTSISGKNTLQFQNVEGAFVNGLSTAYPPPAGDKIDFSESLQNYLMNLETSIINQPDYDPNEKLTVSERVFWKWLKEIGGIRWRNASEQESVVNNRYEEESNNVADFTMDLYSRVVKTIGEIDMEGSHRSGSNSYKEVYVYIPTQAGTTPDILFKCISDKNYYPSMALFKQSSVGREYIEGRDASDNPTFAGLSVNALYDMDVSYGNLSYLVNSDPNQKIWFDSLASIGPDCYFTETEFDNPVTDLIQRTTLSSSQSVVYKRNKLDGVVIDFDIANYYKSTHNTSLIRNFADLNNSSGSDSYKFNAVLIYYDIFDPNNENDRATNLYGVYFLKDMVNVSSGGAQIDTYTKIKPNQVLWEQGNGFGFKINMKFDTTADNVLPEIEISVNDYNTFSMQLFTETMQNIGLTLNKMEKINQSNAYIKTIVGDLQSMVISGYNAQQIQSKLSEFDERLSGIVQTTDLQDMYVNLKNTVDNILRGNTTVGLDFFLDIRTNNGIKSNLVSNVLNLDYVNQQYEKTLDINIDERLFLEKTFINVIELGQFTNIYFHKNNGIEKTAGGNIQIFIDDKNFVWKTGKCIEIAILDPIEMNGNGYIFWTDSVNRSQSSGIYEKLVGTISYSQMIGNKTPTFKIVCMDENMYKFNIIIN